MSEQQIWDAPPLPAEDQQLIEAYSRTGRALDDLAYTSEFEQLFSQLRQPDTIEARHSIYQRLLRLRKTGRLPRLGRSGTDTF